MSVVVFLSLGDFYCFEPRKPFNTKSWFSERGREEKKIKTRRG